MSVLAPPVAPVAPVDVPETDLTPAIIAAMTLERLREVGWVQRKGMDLGHRQRVCIAYAAVQCTGCDHATHDAFVMAFRRLTGAETIPQWNDVPGRTFEEVERVLEKIAAS